MSITEQFRFVLEKSSGTFFIWHAYDDYLSSDFIKKSVEFLNKTQSCCVVQGSTQLVLQPKNKKELIKFHHKDYIFKPKEIINSLLSEKKFNYFIYGLFRSEILKKSYLKFDVKSSDRYFLLQFPLANYNFGYLENCIYFRGNS